MDDKSNAISKETREQKKKEIIDLLKGLKIGEAFKILSRVQDYLIREIIL